MAEDVRSAGANDVTVVAHLLALREADKQLLAELSTRFEARLTEADLRYQQRYDAQQKAVEDALLAAEKAVQAALVSSEKAVAKVEIATEKRFDSVNEFRGQLSDQASSFISRNEYHTAHESLVEKVNQLGDQAIMLITRSEADQRLSSIAEKIVVLNDSFSQRFEDSRSEITSIRLQMSQSAGRGQGMSDTGKLIISGVGLIATILVIVAFFLAR